MLRVPAARLRQARLFGSCFSLTERASCYATQSAEQAKEKRPYGYWRDRENQRACLDEIAAKLGLKEVGIVRIKLNNVSFKMSDWYEVTRKDVITNGGAMLMYHNRSLPHLLRNVYTEFNWEPARFSPAGRRCSKENLMASLNMIEEKLGILQPEDWYAMRLTDMYELGFPKEVGTVGVAELLREKYPNQSWEKLFLLKGKYSQQKRLERAIGVLFPGVEVKVNVRKESGLVNPETGNYFELDVYVPSLKLALEYQEKHHYVTAVNFSEIPLEVTMKRDAMKKQAASEQGITLIDVPCWWDYRTESLAATIKAVRPDLEDLMTLVNDAAPIAEIPPIGFFDKHIDYVEDIGEPMIACFFTNSKIDPVNWWMFEKYDGVRAFWNPLKKTFYSRKGRKLRFPPEIVASMPESEFLDGEIWFGRGGFHEATKIAFKGYDTRSVDWTKFQYIVFDMPKLRGTYAERYEALKEVVNRGDNKYIRLAEYERCKDISHLETFFQDVIDKGGEGIILRDPNSPYKPGLSTGYLKHKRFRDSEAKVIKVVGPLVWECELPNGVTFTAPAGTTEFAKRWNPQPGDIVSFKHRGFLHGSMKPKLPTVYRLRTDLTWEDVVRNFKTGKSPNPFKVKPLKRGERKPTGFWKKFENRRQFFIEFAKEGGFDPFVVHSWRGVTSEQVIKKGGRALLTYCKGIERALVTSFPELSFPVTKPKDYWDDIENRKTFFLNMAAELDFNPYVAENWDSVTGSDVRRRKGTALLNKYRTLPRALADTFPDLKFEVHKPKGYWSDIENRRKFLLDIAEELHINPKSPSDWETLTIAKVREKRGGGLLTQYGGIQKLLRLTFPEIYAQG